MDANAIALLQQLASNPQMVSQLQSVLTTIGNSSSAGNSMPHSMAHASGNAPTAGLRPASPQDTFSSSSSASSPAVTLSTGASAFRSLAPGQRQQQQSHPHSYPQGFTAAVGGGYHGSVSGRPSTAYPQPQQPSTSSSMPTISLQKYEQLERLLQETDAEKKELSRAATTAESRARDMEKEVQRLTQRVEQLTAMVSDQRQQQRTAEEQHQLALDELKHTHESVLRRKEEVHEESLRQLLQSRQLYSVAKKFEDTVKTRGGGILTDGAIPINIRNNDNNKTNHSNTTTGSMRKALGDGAKVSQGTTTEEKLFSPHKGSGGVKRERSTSLDDRAHKPYTMTKLQQQQQHGGSRGVVSGSGTSPSLTVSSPRTITSRLAAAAAAHNSSNGSTAKKSTTLLGRSGNSSRKRRTPRTPSLTNADRIASSRSPLPPLPPSFSAGGGASMKLDTPTPTPIATAVTAGHDHHHHRTMGGSAIHKSSHSTSHRMDRSRPKPDTYTSDDGEDIGADGEALVASNTLTPIGTHIRHQQPPGVAVAQQRFVSQYDDSGRGPGGPQQRTKNKTARPPLPSPTPRPPQQQQQQQQARQHGAVPSTASGASSAVGGPTRSPSPVNPKRGPALPRRFIYTGINDPEPDKLSAAIEAIGDDAMALAGDLDEPPPFSTTHIVVRGTPRSVKALCGVVSGKWLVPPEYVYNSRSAGFWLDEYEEGGLRVFPPPLKCQRFLLTIEHPLIREKIRQVIEYGGGEVVNKASSAGEGSGKAASAARQQWTEQGVIVITSGDDLLRYATQAPP